MNNIKIGITGLPSAGKTNTLIQVIKMLEAEGFKVGGMITEPILDDKKRTGLYVIDWITKKKAVLAATDIESKFTVGKYGIDIQVLEDIGVQALTNACADADVIVIDEVGKIEVESKKFVKAVEDALEVEKPMLLTLHKKSRNPLLQDIRRRDDVRILEVTPINRNLLPYKIMKLMKGELL
ncbi:MAG TPA: NTPase [Methanomassiliicoccales archaeon]|nr:NTPase [Methanomassiliicoccales archaeon]